MILFKWIEAFVVTNYNKWNTNNMSLIMENLKKLFIFKNLKKKKNLYIILLIVEQQKIKQISLFT